MIRIAESKILSSMDQIIKKVDTKIGSEVGFMIKNDYSLNKIYDYLKNNLSPEKNAELMEKLFDAYGDKIQLYVENSVDAEIGKEKNVYAIVENLFDVPLEFTVEINSREGEKEIIYNEETKENVKILSKTLLIDTQRRERFRFVVTSKEKSEVTLYWIAALTEFPLIRRVDKTIIKFQ